MPVESLALDDRNANQHSADSIAKIAGSLREYGQRTPIVVQARPDGSRVVRKGNGTLQAARLNGWSHIACVIVEEPDAKATGYAIVDNAAGRYSAWNEDLLAELLQEVEFNDPELADLSTDLERLLAGIDDQPADAEPEQEPPAKTTKDRTGFHVLITMPDEQSQVELLERLTEEGLECRTFVV